MPKAAKRHHLRKIKLKKDKKRCFFFLWIFVLSSISVLFFYPFPLFLLVFPSICFLFLEPVRIFVIALSFRLVEILLSFSCFFFFFVALFSFRCLRKGQILFSFFFFLCALFLFRFFFSIFYFLFVFFLTYHFFFWCQTQIKSITIYQKLRLIKKLRNKFLDIGTWWNTILPRAGDACELTIRVIETSSLLN